MSNPRIGKMIGAYRVERTLGGGGMGTVYLVEHAALRQPRALKVLNAPPGLSEQELEERYLREPQLVASLSHPNIIPVTDAGVDQGAPYLVMPLIEGEDLRARVEEEGPLRPAQAVRIVAAVGAALDAVHDRGIVHRDVKPGNVMLADDGGVYLTDFGIAKANVADPAASVRFAGTSPTLRRNR
jgi:serine/threonine protein kinase